MAERTLDSPTRCEHYPLLKVSGAGDSVARNEGGSTCGVHTVPRRPVFDRWPEIMSACWMTAVLLGICFLTLYVLGVAMTKRQALVVQYMKERESRHTDSTVRVYYHHVVERGASIDFPFYSDYLSKMSLLYPHLRINVYFLIHDAYKASRGHLLFGKLIEQTPMIPIFYKIDDTRDITTFMRKHPNVNITVMPLSKYMAMTPLKQQWRSLPLPYISFYARVFAVWHHGGIGIDLRSSNIAHLTHQATDSRITAIFKHFNEGESKYSLNTSDLPRFDDDVPTILNVMIQMLNKSMEMFSNSSLLTPTNSTESLASKHTRRNKRDIQDTVAYNATNSSLVVFETEVTTNGTAFYTTAPSIATNNTIIINPTKPVNTTDIVTEHTESQLPILKLPEANTDKDSTSTALLNRSEEFTQPLIFYSFMEFRDIGPSYKLSEPIIPNFLLPSANVDIQTKDTRKYLLTLDSEGKFISSYSGYHPLLGHIMYNFQRMAPRVAIQDALMTHCFSLLRNDNFCNNVYML